MITKFARFFLGKVSIFCLFIKHFLRDILTFPKKKKMQGCPEFYNLVARFGHRVITYCNVCDYLMKLTVFFFCYFL